MPLSVWNQADFSAFYQMRVSDPSHPKYNQIITYGREFAQMFENPQNTNLTMYERRRDLVLNIAPIQPSDRILIVGCGFGFLNETFIAAGYANTYGIDSSPYVESNKGVEAANGIVLVSDDVRGGGRVLNILRTETGGDTFDWVLTEDLAGCYEDADVQNFAPVLETLLAGQDNANIIHMVTISDSPSAQSSTLLHWHTLAEWNALVPSHTWMNIATGEAL